MDRPRKPRCVFSKGTAARQAGRGPPHCWRETRGRQTGQSMATLVTTAPGRQEKREGGVDCFFLPGVQGSGQREAGRPRQGVRGSCAEQNPKQHPGAKRPRQGRQVGKRSQERTRRGERDRAGRSGKDPKTEPGRKEPQTPGTRNSNLDTTKKTHIPGVKPQFPGFFEFEFRVFWVRVLGFKVSGPLRVWDLECRLTGFGIWGGV